MPSVDRTSATTPRSTARLTVSADFDALAIANNRPFALANANVLNAATDALRGKALSRTRRSARLAAPLVCHERPTFAGAVVDTRGLRSKHGWRVNRFKLRRVKKVVAEVVDDALVDTVIEVAKHHDEY